MPTALANPRFALSFLTNFPRLCLVWLPPLWCSLFLTAGGGCATASVVVGPPPLLSIDCRRPMSRKETGHVRKRPRSACFKAIGSLADYPPWVAVPAAAVTRAPVAAARPSVAGVRVCGSAPDCRSLLDWTSWPSLPVQVFFATPGTSGWRSSRIAAPRGWPRRRLRRETVLSSWIAC